MSISSTAQRRKSERTRRAGVIRLETKDNFGHAKVVTADLLDVSSDGIGIAVRFHLKPGSMVVVRGNLGSENPTLAQAEVRWCVEGERGFQAGLAFFGAEPKDDDATHKPKDATSEQDYYELMQLSPNADADTVARVYRFLAQRYHPDNVGSGNSELFVQLTEAYRVLSDSEARARYDALHQESRRLRWRIFDSNNIAAGKDEEDRKRRGVLALLYAKMLHDPETASMTIFEFEDLLSCPREHLQATLWYLRGKGYVQRTDKGRYTITIQGFDEAEGNNCISNDRSERLQLESAVREQ